AGATGDVASDLVTTAVARSGERDVARTYSRAAEPLQLGLFGQGRGRRGDAELAVQQLQDFAHLVGVQDAVVVGHPAISWAVALIQSGPSPGLAEDAVGPCVSGPDGAGG